MKKVCVDLRPSGHSMTLAAARARAAAIDRYLPPAPELQHTVLCVVSA